MIIIVAVASAAVGFLFGVLFGRKNVRKVDQAVTDANRVISQVRKL